MLLCIDVKQENIVFQKGGRIIVKVDFYTEIGQGAWLVTTKGETKEDFDKSKVYSGTYLNVGQKGGLSLEKPQY